MAKTVIKILIVFSLMFPLASWAKVFNLPNYDSDRDGLTDSQELIYKTNPNNPDTDSDGYTDKDEIDNGFSPNIGNHEKADKAILVDLRQQKMAYYFDGAKIGEFIVSSGKKDSTPRGRFTVEKKLDKAWSRQARVWMPYWMSFKDGVYGLHSLVIYRNGIVEPEGNLGLPVSSGCVRLKKEDAKFLYNWANLGTRVIIK